MTKKSKQRSILLQDQQTQVKFDSFIDILIAIGNNNKNPQMYLMGSNPILCLSID